MKKFALAVVATAFIAIGHGSVNAQTPDPGLTVPENSLVECGESDGRIDNDEDGIADACLEFYVGAGGPTTTQPPATTTTTTVAITAGPLPSTGSGISPVLGMGAALLIGGGIIVVATRRRSTATAS